ncbi:MULTISPECIES: UDP-N-acetylmuramoyl-L-alanyl-D-glutamate--2,6-diaminopimelate ligase [Corynebacterium]|uniref:UDP-N-acetylmuramoyl-L-alanyl-D-glutamate--2, 6-diaminopimelate ligase n=1 Tax=Corynebacterium TaxID=1716 RepID=UPI00124C838D|nr:MULTISPECIES: UDP-N-acetylmuramoyl-L-alanyl-D-glutamate--2,6-diaminopimelate ligase [Corynebacterium]
MALNFSEVLNLSGGSVINEPSEALSVSEIGLDSTQLPSGAVFAALPGTKVHGATYAGSCEAAVILTDQAGAAILRDADETRPIIVVEDVREILGPVSAAIYNNPSEKLSIIGVTGTSGKTTTSYMLEKGMMKAGHRVGLIGTTGTRINGTPVATKLTTPEAPTLQKLFATMVEEDVTHVIMEVSSHALVLGRVAGTHFAVAGFSNLSQDHLDFHPTMEEYFEAKALFFDPSSTQHAAQAVVCIDDHWGESMAERAGESVLRVATHGQSADVTASDIEVSATGSQRFTLTVDGAAHTVELPLPGRFNVANAALAIACAHAAGADVDAVAQGIAEVAVPGRMESIDEGQDFMAVVDYAHKPGAIAEVLDTVRAQISGRVAAVIGAGGDRDATKRPIMGAEAVKRADFVVITDDNPRSEEPASIRAEVVRGATEQQAETPGAEVTEIGDRREAIIAAINWAQPGDAVVVCGKGHETGQLIKGVNHHFDDREEVRAALQQRGTESK